MEPQRQLDGIGIILYFIMRQVELAQTMLDMSAGVIVTVWFAITGLDSAEQVLHG